MSRIDCIFPLNNPSNYFAEIYCFPWAGGGKNSFRSLAKNLEQKGILLYGVLYNSKKFNEFHQAPLTQLDVDFLKDKFHSLLKKRSTSDKPIVFFGYSYGGLVAYELLKWLEVKIGGSFCIANLIVCSIASPGFLGVKNQNFEMLFHDKSEEVLIEHIIKIGGLPAGVDKEFLKQALPSIRNDYKAFETYDPTKFELSNYILKSPITSLHCSADTMIPRTAFVDGWGSHCSEYSFSIITGGSHFFLMDSEGVNVLEYFISRHAKVL